MPGKVTVGFCESKQCCIMWPEKFNTNRRDRRAMRLIRSSWLAAILLALNAPWAGAADYVLVRMVNPTEMKWNVEVRDLVCEGSVLWQGKMEPGQVKKLRVCAGDDGLGTIRAVVAGGCASAKATIHEGLAKGTEISVAPSEE